MKQDQILELQEKIEINYILLFYQDYQILKALWLLCLRKYMHKFIILQQQSIDRGQLEILELKNVT